MSGVVIAREELRVVSDNPADIRAVTLDGREFQLVKRSLTVARYDAVCDQRTYTVRRTGGSLIHKRRSVVNASGELVATTIAHPSGKIDVVPALADAPELDLGFIGWGLSLVDAPINNLRY